MPQPACIPQAVFGVPVDHVAADQDDVADVACLRADRPRLLACVAALPAEPKAVLIRHFGLGTRPRGLREIAAELGMSVDTAHRRERQALELLRQWF